MYVCCMYVCMYVCVYVYIYMYLRIFVSFIFVSMSVYQVTLLLHRDLMMETATVIQVWHRSGGTLRAPAILLKYKDR